MAFGMPSCMTQDFCGEMAVVVSEEENCCQRELEELHLFQLP